jgi:hypothetical protein
MNKLELKKEFKELGIPTKGNYIRKSDLKKVTSKYALGAGEMEQSEIEKGGEWYGAREDLEKICKESGMGCKVMPFDQYQGPFAKLKNGGKLWIKDADVFYYEGPKGPKNLKGKEMVEFLTSLTPFKPKIAYKSPSDKTPGVKWPRTRSTPEQRKHLQLIKSVLAELLKMKGIKK